MKEAVIYIQNELNNHEITRVDNNSVVTDKIRLKVKENVNFCKYGDVNLGLTYSRTDPFIFNSSEKVKTRTISFNGGLEFGIGQGLELDLTEVCFDPRGKCIVITINNQQFTVWYPYLAKNGGASEDPILKYTSNVFKITSGNRTYTFEVSIYPKLSLDKAKKYKFDYWNPHKDRVNLSYTDASKFTLKIKCISDIITGGVTITNGISQYPVTLKSMKLLDFRAYSGCLINPFYCSFKSDLNNLRLRPFGQISISPNEVPDKKNKILYSKFLTVYGIVYRERENTPINVSAINEIKVESNYVNELRFDEKENEIMYNSLEDFYHGCDVLTLAKADLNIDKCWELGKDDELVKKVHDMLPNDWNTSYQFRGSNGGSLSVYNITFGSKHLPDFSIGENSSYQNAKASGKNKEPYNLPPYVRFYKDGKEVYLPCNLTKVYPNIDTEKILNAIKVKFGLYL